MSKDIYKNQKVRFCMMLEQTNLQTLDPQIERQRYTTCKVLEDNMELPAKEIFKKILGNEDIINYIKKEHGDWLLERQEIIEKELPIDLVTILYTCMNTLLLEYGEDASAALKAYKKKKRDRQDYALKAIVEEYKGTAGSGNPKYLHNQADAYFELLAVDSSINSPYKTKDEYIKFLYDSIYEWGKNSDRNLCEYKFFNKIQIERKVAFLFIDLSVFILNYIVNKNAGRFDVSVVSFPSSLTENGSFGFKNQHYDTEVAIGRNGKVQNIIPYNFEENGQTTYNKTIINEVDMEHSSYTEPSKELLDILTGQYGFVDNSRGLSNFSLHLVGAVYSLLNPSSLSHDWIHFEDGKVFVKSVLQKSKITKKDCLKVREELIKLQNTKMETKKYDSNGNLLEEAYFSFFETKFTYGQDKIGEEKYRETAFSDNKNGTEQDPVEDYDFIGKEWSLSIAPSSYLKDEWKNQKNTDIYSKLYKLSVSNKVSEVVTILFQQLRIENLEPLCTSIEYSYLRNRLKGNGMKLNLFKKELDKELAVLKSSGIIIKDYALLKTYMTVEFLPLSDIENEVYGFRKSFYEQLSQ